MSLTSKPVARSYCAKVTSSRSIIESSRTQSKAPRSEQATLGSCVREPPSLFQVPNIKYLLNTNFKASAKQILLHPQYSSKPAPHPLFKPPSNLLSKFSVAGLRQSPRPRSTGTTRRKKSASVLQQSLQRGKFAPRKSVKKSNANTQRCVSGCLVLDRRAPGQATRGRRGLAQGRRIVVRGLVGVEVYR